MVMKDPEAYREDVNRSGFPLQIALANTIRNSEKALSWRVLLEEHSWRNKSGVVCGFIDLVLENPSQGAVLLIECKRMQDTSYILLPREGVDHPTSRARALLVLREKNGTLVRPYPAWIDVELTQPSPEVEFCHVQRSGGSRDLVIETLATQLMSAAEALEEEERTVCDSHSPMRCYFSVLVTTAELLVCSFDPADISLSDGKIPPGAKFAPHGFVRFRKQVGAPTVANVGVPKKSSDWELLTEYKQRTVFIVQATFLTTFLNSFEIIPPQDDSA
jgi:hypothetical protein